MDNKINNQINEEAYSATEATIETKISMKDRITKVGKTIGKGVIATLAVVGAVTTVAVAIKTVKGGEETETQLLDQPSDDTYIEMLEEHSSKEAE